MEERHLGKSGLRVPLVGLGCNNFGARLDAERSSRVINHALDIGVTLFDCADVYGNRGGAETILGEALGSRRQEAILATKFGFPMADDGRKQGGSRRYIINAVEASLKRLKTDWIDIYELHVPDPQTPIEETLRALEELIRQGKVRYIGCSGLAAHELVEASWVARELGTNAFICCLQHYNVLTRDIEKEIVPAMKLHGIGLLPFFPLAGGLLSGKYSGGAPLPEGARLTVTQDQRFLNEKNLAQLAKLQGFCDERGHTMLELAFSWLAGRPLVASVMAGATSEAQLDANVKAVGWKLSAADYLEIDRLLGL